MDSPAGSASDVTAPAPRVRAGRALQKGQQTKAAIIDAALGLATHIGLEGLSIGALADVTGMSKSGVFAHFGSREELQISVIHEYHARFEQEVFYPAMACERGVARLRALFGNWMQRSSVEIDSGCIYISGAVEFDERTGPVRDALARSVMTWHGAMKRAIVQAKERGELRADVDPDQMLFEIHGLILALHYEARFLKNPGSLARAITGFNNILARFGAAVAAPGLSSVSSVSTPSPLSKE
ncbi:MAG: TetR/AcrR family transcriptional regulator [Simplicispira sp.]|nr:TetR/AcrR family transcriptional regulator [Simplicispira sp.]